MADVLGKYSFLDTPDVNGVLVLLEGGAVGAVSGTANQIAVSGLPTNRIVSIENNAILPGNASLTLPIGTTAQRPLTPTAGMARFNSTLGVLEYYNGTNWIRSGSVIQTVIGNITSSSSNSQIPFDNTTPLSTEGFQLWSQSFTPILPDSTIIITTNIFFSVNSANNIFTTGATFSGTTCIYAQMIGFTTDTGDGGSVNVSATEVSGSTTARTYSFRAGPNGNVTVFYCQGTAGQAYGSTTNSGRYIIQEIAP